MGPLMSEANNSPRLQAWSDGPEAIRCQLRATLTELQARGFGAVEVGVGAKPMDDPRLYRDSATIMLRSFDVNERMREGLENILKGLAPEKAPSLHFEFMELREDAAGAAEIVLLAPMRMFPLVLRP
jgi:hypothetical protein